MRVGIKEGNCRIKAFLLYLPSYLAYFCVMLLHGLVFDGGGSIPVFHVATRNGEFIPSFKVVRALGTHVGSIAITIGGGPIFFVFTFIGNAVGVRGTSPQAFIFVRL